MKVGDYVTPNDIFYLFWKCEPPFSVKVKSLETSGIVFFDEEVETYSIGVDEIEKSNFFHTCYLKVDIKKEREEKLKKLNSYENR